jgi:hypothetical protein
MIIPVGAINNNINCVQDNKVSIPGFKLNMVTGATSAKIRFLESFTGREFLQNLIDSRSFSFPYNENLVLYQLTRVKLPF